MKRYPLRTALTAAMLLYVLHLLSASPASALDQTQANALVDHLLAQTGRTRGIAVVPRCGNGTVARALIERSGMLVHATDSDPAAVAATRALLLPTTQVGRRAYVEESGVTPLLVAENSVDLMVLCDLLDADLSAISFDDIQRALCPGGTAYVGRASAEGGGLTAAALQTWSSGKPEVSVSTDAQGTWAIIGKSEREGIDIWTHRFHGPDNNPSSSDTVVQFPFLLQYRQKPYNNGRYGSVVTSNGRLFVAFNDEGGRPRRRILRAYRMYNGQMLWKRDLTGVWPDNPEVYPLSYSFMFTKGEHLYMMQGGSVLKLNGETGEQEGEITFATDSREVRWTANVGDIIYALVGDPANDTSGYIFGTTVEARDINSGALTWSHDENGLIDNREIGISSGRCVYYVKGVRVVARDATSGTQLWENASVVSSLDDQFNDGALVFCVGGHDGMLLSPNAVYLCTAEDNTFVSLDASDGSLRYSTSRASNANRAQHKVLVNGTVMAKNIETHDFVDDATGQDVSASYSGYGLGGGCGPMSTTTRYLFGQAGGLVEQLDPLIKFPGRDLKVDCSTPTVFSNGFTISAPSGCGCPNLHRGLIAVTPAGGFQFDRQADPAARLETGPALGSVSSTLTPGANDWWTHRANNDRTGGVAVNVSYAPRLRWTYTPALTYQTALDSTLGNAERPEEGQTPAVTVGDYVFFGGTDGFVRCVRDGVQQWVYPTGGRIQIAPTVANGCVFVGSADGYAYCLDAADGDLVWRFRAAPAERRINLYGHLSSTWPVITGVLVHDGKAYFGAGVLDEYGTHVYCVNASTGALVWQNNAGGTFYNQDGRRGFTPSGAMTIFDGKLWVRAHACRDGVFDLTTGELQPLPTVLQNRNDRTGGPTIRGMDIGVIDNRHMLRGGRLLYSDKRERDMYVRRVTYQFLRLGSDGTPVYPEVQISDWASIVTPAWDSNQFFVCLAGNWYLESWSTSGFIQRIDSLQAAHDVVANPSDWPWWKQLVVTPDWCPGWNLSQMPASLPMSQWRQLAESGNRYDLNAIALAANALVVAQTEPHGVSGDANKPQNWTWQLVYLNRTDGSIEWQATLPGEPAWQGLTIASNGDVLVTLTSGDILCYGDGPVSVTGGEIAMADVLLPEPAAHVSTRGWEPPTGDITAQRTSAPVSHATAAGPRSDQPSAPIAGVAYKSSAGAIIAPRRQDTAEPTRTNDELASHGATAACVAEGNEISPYDRGMPEPYEPRSMRWQPDRPSLEIRGVQASSSDGPNAAAHTLDGDLRSWWAADDGGTQWLVYDLGTTREVTGATCVWYGRESDEASAEVSLSVDGETFEPADTWVVSGSGTNVTMRTFLPQQARYVRLSLTPSIDGAMPCLYEMALHAGR
ncbi:MAG: PQQ-binding-like beta-propeller repeat protein [Chitinivibrionales bacterium]|nr:PQQ-binding-like beta-propeller repeat protein [Chitinivibrionales bacterium]